MSISLALDYSVLPADQPSRIDSETYLKSKRIVFLHLPKTGGTSIATLLRNVFGDSHVLRLRMEDNDIENKLQAVFTNKMQSFHCVDGHLPLYLVEPYRNDAKLFTVLRDPIDRMRSIYEFLLGHSPEELRTYGLDKGFSFENLITTRNPKLYAQVNNGMARMFSRDRNSFDHSNFLFWHPDEPALLSDALQALSWIRFGLLEEMDSTFHVVQDMLDLPIQSIEYHENKTPKRGSPLDSESIRQIIAMNQVDLALYHAARSMFVTSKAAIGLKSRNRRSGDPYVLQAPSMTEISVRDIPGRYGFHEFEPEGLAWIVAEQTARIAFRITDGTVRLQLRLYRITADYPVSATEISVNGKVLDHEVVEQDDCWTALRTQPFSHNGDVNVLTLKPPFSVPARFLWPDSGDDRYLSVALGSLLFDAG